MSDNALEQLKNANNNLKDFTDLSNNNLQESINNSRQEILDSSKSNLDKLKQSNEALEKSTKEAKGEIQASKDLIEKQEQEKLKGKEKADVIINKIESMCENKDSKVDDIEKKFKELNDDLKQYVDDYGSIKTIVDKFKSNVESQKREIEELKTTLNLKDTKTEKKVDEIEEGLDSIKEIYADNKELKEDLKDAIKLKRDKLEDQAIIEEIKGLIDKEAENNEKYKTEEETRGDETKLMSEWDKLAIEKIVEADFGPRPNKSSEEPLSMIEEVIKELGQMDEYIKGDKMELGILDYDLSPIGVKIVRDYIEKQNPDEILNNATKEEKKKKSIIEKNKEHNIDMVNLLLGGILTQDFVDLINSDPKENPEALLKDIKKYLEKVVEFTKAIDDDKIGEGVVKVFDEIKKRESSFGLKPEVVLGINKLVKDLGATGKKVLQIHRSAQYIVSRLNSENAKDYFKRLTDLLKGKNTKQRISILTKLTDGKWNNKYVKTLDALTGQKNILLSQNKDAKFEIYEEGSKYRFWESKPLRIVNTLLLLDFCFEDNVTKGPKDEIEEGILTSNEKIDEIKIDEVSKLTWDQKKHFNKQKEEEIKKLIQNFKNTRRKNKFGEVAEVVSGGGGNILLKTTKDKKSKEKLKQEKINKKINELKQIKILNEDDVNNYIDDIELGTKGLFTDTDNDYETVNTDINYLQILYKIMDKYFEKEETGEWKFQTKYEKKYKEIMDYFRNPKYIIKEGTNVPEVVKCYAILNKLSTAKNTKKHYVKVKDFFVKDVNDIVQNAETFEYEVEDVNIKQKTGEFDVIRNNQENLLSWNKDKGWTTVPKYDGRLKDKIEIKDPQSIIEDQMKEIDEQLKQKAEFLNSIISKYKRKGELKKGLNESIKANKDIKIPFDRAQVLRMKNFIGRTTTSDETDIIEKRVKHVKKALRSHKTLANNLRKLNIKKKKDYSSFNEIPEGYDPVGVKNEVSEKLYEKLAEIKDSIHKEGRKQKNFGKSRRKNKFGSSGQSQSEEENIGKLKSEASDELIDLINQELGENLLGNIFKPKIDEQRVKELIKAIPNERLRDKMTKKLDSKLKNTQPASLGDLNRKINKDTKELTRNTNKIFDKVKNLVDRIHKKDKRIIQLKNEIEREKSISITKLSNSKETFELNRKNLQDQLNARNREIENIEAKQLNNHRKLVAQFSNINLKDKSKQEELTRILNETKSNNLKELQELRVTIQNNYNRQLKSVIRDLEQKKNQELQLERNKLAEAEKKAEAKIKTQVEKALQTKKEYENALRNQERKYTKLSDEAKKQCSERNNKIDEVCKQKIVELKTDYKNFERRVGRIFEKQRQDNERKIKKIEEEAEKENKKDSEESKAKVIRYQEEIKRLKGIANELSNRQKEALGKGIERRESKIKYLEDLAVKNKDIGTKKLVMTENKLREDFKNKKDELKNQLKTGIELNRQKSALETQANTMKIQKNANEKVEQIKNNLENKVDKIEENAEERIKQAEAETEKIKKEAKEELDKRLLELKTQEDTLLKQFNEELDKASKESQGKKVDFEKMKAKLTEDYNKNMETIRQQKYDVQQKANDQLARQQQQLRDKEDRMKQTNEKKAERSRR